MLNIIAENVKSKLSKKVQGTVSCHAVGDDTIVCDIICNGNVFRYIGIFTKEEITYGLSLTLIADDILHDYVMNLKSKFFK